MKFNLSINQRLLLIFSLLLIFLIVLAIPLVNLNFKINQVSYQVDLAGRNRMLTQRIAANIMMWKASKNEAQQEDAKKKLKKAYLLLKKSLDVLEKGGAAPGYDNYMSIIASNEDERFQISLVKELLELQEKDFYDVLISETPIKKQSLEKIDTIKILPTKTSLTATSLTLIAPNTLSVKTPSFTLKKRMMDTLIENVKYTQAFTKFVTSYTESQLLNACIELVKTYVKKNDEANKFLYQYLIIAGVLVLIAIIITIVSCFRVVKTIRQPVKEAVEVLKELGEGQIPSKIKIHKKDELTDMLISVNKMIDNMNEMVNYTQEVGSGNFSNKITLFNNSGAIYESLEKMRSNLQKVEQEDAKRAWFNQGLAELGEILRLHQNDIERLYPSLIKFIVKYVTANQGALFLVIDENDQAKFMELVSFYGYEKHRYYERKLELSEGLVGQAYIDREPIFLTEVPQFYTKITSGIGEATPNCLALFPLLFNEAVIGVIEIAAFEVFDEHKINFLNRISESIASAIYTVKNTTQTKNLLEVSQQQSEELRSQEEEMRQNVEELRAKHEEMRRINQENVEQRKEIEEKHRLNVLQMDEQKHELDEQISVINQSLAFVEFDLDGIIINANSYFLQSMRYSLDEIKGKHHSVLVDKAYSISDEYRDFWSRLRNRELINSNFAYLNANNEVVNFIGCHTLLLDVKKNPRKFAMLGQNINQFW
jgi:methyl-accepting chemotaxis protein/GAF domain-containing protein